MAYYTQNVADSISCNYCCIPADHYILYGCFANILSYDDMSTEVSLQAWWSSPILRSSCLQIDQIEELPNLS